MGLQAARCLLRHVQPAFGLLETGPPPCPKILACLHLTRAVGASNARITLVVKRIVRYVVRPDVVPHLFPFPVGQGVEFDQAKLGIPLELARVGAGRRLVTADSRDPSVKFTELLGERLDLAKVAALVGLTAPKCLTERSRLFLGGEPGSGPLHLDLITTLDIVNKFIRFAKQEVSIECENPKSLTRLGGEVNQYDIFGAKAGCDGDSGAEPLQGQTYEVSGAESLRIRWGQADFIKSSTHSCPPFDVRLNSGCHRQ